MIRFAKDKDLNEEVYEMRVGDNCIFWAEKYDDGRYRFYRLGGRVGEDSIMFSIEL